MVKKRGRRDGRRTIPGTNIPIGRKPRSSGISQQKREEINRQIQQSINPPVVNQPARKTPRLGSKERPRLYGTGDPLDVVPFNVDNRPRNTAVRKLFDEAGYVSWRDLFITKEQTRGAEESGFRRGHVFTTPNDAVAYGKDGLLQTGLMRIYYDPVSDMYYVYVMDSS